MRREASRLEHKKLTSGGKRSVTGSRWGAECAGSEKWAWVLRKEGLPGGRRGGGFWAGGASCRLDGMSCSGCPGLRKRMRHARPNSESSSCCGDAERRWDGGSESGAGQFLMGLRGLEGWVSDCGGRSAREGYDVEGRRNIV